MVLSLTKCVSYTVKRLCGWKTTNIWELLFEYMYLFTVDYLKKKSTLGWRQVVPTIKRLKAWFFLPLKPSPMKILYLSELQRTTPTNFLYHVRLTYWLPLQLLWVGLYLKVKGIQIGSPPVEERHHVVTGKLLCCGPGIRYVSVIAGRIRLHYILVRFYMHTANFNIQYTDTWKFLCMKVFHYLFKIRLIVHILHCRLTELCLQCSFSTVDMVKLGM